MKLLVTKNQYKKSNNELNVSPDLKEISAYSYEWWQYIATDKVGNVIFNNTTYSNSTRKHQSDSRRKLGDLGIDFNLTLNNTTEDLTDIKKCIDSEIETLNSQIEKLHKIINKKGTHKSKNEERKHQIKNIEYRILDLTDFRDNYLDKKIYPVKRNKADYTESVCKHGNWIYKCKDECYKKPHVIGIPRETQDRLDSYKKYFVKPNGKLQTNEYQEFIYFRKLYDNAPNSLEKLKLLLNLDQKSIQIALKYKHIADVENMIPDVDHKAYADIQKFVKKHGIDRNSLNLFLLDKIHTYQINQINKKTYSKKEEIQFPTSEKLLKIENTEHLKLIKKPSDLRAEGRTQGHCIGSKHYITQCYQGYQALNYKGYTFFLSPNLEIDQTHGKHNCSTPDHIQEELENLISA